MSGPRPAVLSGASLHKTRHRSKPRGYKRSLLLITCVAVVGSCSQGAGKRAHLVEKEAAAPAVPAPPEAPGAPEGPPGPAVAPEAPPPPPVVAPMEAREHFLKGAIAWREKNYPEAAACFESALRYPSGWEEYALYYLIKARRASGDSNGSVSLCREFLRRFPASPLWRRVKVMEAETYREDPARLGLALEVYEELLLREDSADLRLSHGAVLESLGRLSAAYANYLRIREKWPRSAAAAKARKRMREIEKKSPQLAGIREQAPGLLEESRLCLAEGAYDEALYRYRLLSALPLGVEVRRSVLEGQVLSCIMSGKQQEALSALQVLMERHAGSGEEIRSLLVVGKELWRKNQDAEAYPFLTRVLEHYTDTAESMQASYIMGRIKEEEGDRAAAIEQYRRTRFIYPGTEWDQESAWREAWCYYLLSDFASCAELLKAYEETGIWTGELLPRSRYWVARCLEKAGNREAAKSLYQRTAEQHPESFYGVMAGRRFAELPLLPRFTAPDDLAHRADLVVQARGEVFERLADPALPLLVEAGFSRDAVERLAWIQARRQPPGMGPEDWGEAYLAAGDYARGIRLSGWEDGLKRFLREHGSGGEMAPPRSVRLGYPLPYWRLILEESRRHDLDPFLVAGLIRQESLFMSDARSPAGALGLMQIMPSTGSFIAKESGREGFQPYTLLNPEVNIRLGTAYLASLAKRYDRQWHKVLANYNAGPNPVARWTAAMPEAELDEYVEGITYRETRLYVKKVLLGGTVYERIYGPADRRQGPP